MAERNVAVKLSANVSQYMAAMAQAKAATSGLSSEGGRSLTRLGAQMQSVGRMASIGITLPLVGVGAGAVAMAAKFDTAFAQMVGLANVPAGEVDALKESVLALAGQTAVAPQELAEGLYFAASAGLDAAEAMDTVEVAAMASAAGMGETSEIVGLVTSAVNAYGAENVTAAEATDILTAAVREGKAEPAEMAQTLGRVLPIAAQMGITFEEVAGATAFLTNIMGGADISTTALRDAFAKLSAPGTAAKAMLIEMGTSFEELQTAIAEDGLLGALELLREHGFDGNAEALRALVPDMQGYTAMAALLADESNSLNGILDATTNSLGANEDAFAAVSDTAGFKMKQALTDIKVAMIQIGDVLLPIVSDIASGISGLIGWFTELDPTVQKVIIAVAGFAAAAGPLVFVAGSLIKNWQAVSKAFTATGVSASKASLALGAIGLAVTVGFMAYQHFTREQRELDERTREVAGSLGEQTTAVLDLASAAVTATGEIDGLAAANSALGLALANTGEDGEKIRKAFGTLGLNISDVVFWMDSLQGTEAQVGSALEEMARQAGVAEEHLFILAQTVMETDENGEALASQLQGNLAEGLNISWEAAGELAAQLMPVASAMEEVEDQSEKFDGNAVTRDFLQLAAGANDTANGLITMAEAQTGLSRNGEHTRSVMAALLEIITALPPEAEAAARAALGMGGANATLAASAEAATDALATEGEAWSALASDQFGSDWFGKATQDVRLFVDAAKELGEVVIKPDLFAGLEKGITSIKGLNEAADKTPESMDEAIGKFDELNAAAGDAAGGFGELEDAVNDLMDAFLGMTDPADDAREAVRALYEEAEETAMALLEASEAGLTLAEAFDVSTETGRNNQRQLEEHRDSIYAHATAMMAEGASAEEAAGHIAWNTNMLRENMLAAGHTEEEVDALIATYFRTPEEVETELRAIGEAQAAAAVGRHKARINGIPTTKPTLVTVSASGVDKVNADLDWLARNRFSTISVSTINTLRVTRAAGGYNDRPEVALWGEAGPEAMFPLSNPGRIRQLWDDPRISGPMLAALGNLTPAPTSSGGASAMAATGDTYYIDVHNNGREVTGDDVARAIVRHRSN